MNYNSEAEYQFETLDEVREAMLFLQDDFARQLADLESQISGLFGKNSPAVEIERIEEQLQERLTATSESVENLRELVKEALEDERYVHEDTAVQLRALEVGVREEIAHAGKDQDDNISHLENQIRDLENQIQEIQSKGKDREDADLEQRESLSERVSEVEARAEASANGVMRHSYRFESLGGTAPGGAALAVAAIVIGIWFYADQQSFADRTGNELASTLKWIGLGIALLGGAVCALCVGILRKRP